MMTIRSSSASFSRLLQELAELGEVGMRDDRLVDMDQRKARYLDVLLLRQRQQQVEELALDLEDLDHLEHAAARSVHGARPRPRARVALVAELRDLGQVDRAHQIGQVGGRRIVRRIRADADAPGLGDEDPLDRHLHDVAAELLLDARAAVRAELALDVDTVGLRGNRARSVCGMRCSGDSCTGQPAIAYSAPASVWLYSSSPRFSRITSVDLPPEGGPSSSNSRRPTSEPAAAALK